MPEDFGSFRLQGITRWSSPFAIGDKVVIDGDRSIFAIVTAHLFRENLHLCEVQWFANGEAKEKYFEVWRLSDADPKPE